MAGLEEVSFQYRENEYFFVDVPAIVPYCLPSLFVEFIRLCVLQVSTNVVYQLIATDCVFRGKETLKSYLASIIGSLLLLYFYPAESVALLVVLLVLLYLLVTRKSLSFLILGSALVAAWFLGLYTLELRQLQGPLMIIAMKSFVVSCADKKDSVNFPMFLHYCLSPSSVVFGPMVTYDEFQAKVFSHRFSLSIRPLLSGLMGTFLTFITSNCICQSVEWAYTGEDIPPYHIRFLTAYKQALEFRMSHYFICYMSSFQVHLGTPKLAEPIVDFWAIEVPRSMKNVVRSWNLPMHSFLKKFIFQKLRPSVGSVVAVVLTFLVSAAFHLFEIRVTVVLLGLSLVSIVESRLEGHLPESLADIWMRVTTFIHLVFFGCIMMGYEEEEDGSYFNFVMQRWLELGFISFKILMVESVLCIVLEVKRLLKRTKQD